MDEEEFKLLILYAIQIEMEKFHMFDVFYTYMR